MILPQIGSICRLHGSRRGAVDLLVGDTREQFQNETVRRARAGLEAEEPLAALRPDPAHLRAQGRPRADPEGQDRRRADQDPRAGAAHRQGPGRPDRGQGQGRLRGEANPGRDRRRSSPRSGPRARRRPRRSRPRPRSSRPRSTPRPRPSRPSRPSCSARPRPIRSSCPRKPRPSGSSSWSRRWAAPMPTSATSSPRACRPTSSSASSTPARALSGPT